MKKTTVLLAITGLQVAVAQAQCSGTTTISTQAQATSLSSCSQYSGSIIIDSSASGSISVGGIQTITGDLSVNNATQLTALSATQLKTITGTFQLQSLQILSTLSFPALSGVNNVYWQALPAIQTLSFASGITTVNSIYISNTGLNTLNGIDPLQVGTINVNNNPYLQVINMNALANVTTAINFAANGPFLGLSFPNLQSAANLTFSNVVSISLPSCRTVLGAMGVYSSYMTSFSAPNLTQAGGTISFVDNKVLANLQFPQLASAGSSLALLNNTNLMSIGGFDKLKTIAGDLQLVGVFSSLSFPSLTDVRGGATVSTDSTNSTICNLITQAKKDQVIKGTATCLSNANSSQTSGTSTSSTSLSASSSSKSGAGSDGGLSKGDIAGIVIGAVIAIIIAIVAFLIARRRTRNSRGLEKDNSTVRGPLSGHHELPRGGHHEKTEMYVNPQDVNEMSGREIKGLPGMHEAPTSQWPVNMVESQSPGGGTDRRAEQTIHTHSTYGSSGGIAHMAPTVATMTEREALEGFGEVDPHYYGGQHR